MLKLVRNKIGARIHATEGKATRVHRLVYPAMLRDKLLEEAEEVSFADGTDELIEELADLATVMASLRDTHGISAWQVWRVRLLKWLRLGGFHARWAIHVNDGKEFRAREAAAKSLVDPL